MTRQIERMLRQRLFVVWSGCTVAPLAPPPGKHTRSPGGKINEILYTLFTLSNLSTHVNRSDSRLLSNEREDLGRSGFTGTNRARD